MKRILLLFLVYALAIPVTAMAETLASPSVSSQNKGGERRFLVSSLTNQVVLS